MARQQRSTTLTQESTRPITRVALYARVSTLNNQDPEMQLAGTARICGAPRLADRRGVHRPGCVGLQGVAAGAQSD